jgi:EAL domain-containing protein (putative c-di-GMP-specific phosphodiesterase class I)
MAVSVFEGLCLIELMHLIYSSTATRLFSDEELADLLKKARAHNININVTGMLLYENGSFFQVIEGPPETIETLFRNINSDPRHSKVITIIHESIVKRSFSEWTMGYSRVSVKDVSEIIGLNDFFTEGQSLNQLDFNRAKKLLNAFKQGRWHTRIQTESKNAKINLENAQPEALEPVESSILTSTSFQPIIDSRSLKTIAYEAMPSDLKGNLLDKHSICHYQSIFRTFNDDYCGAAISVASKLGVNCHLIFTLRSHQVSNAYTTISLMLETAKQLGVLPSGIILKVNQDNLIGDVALFARINQTFRSVGLKLAIDDFGAGRSSMNLLETYQPDYISLNEQLVTGIDSNGARQAIVRGVNQACRDLGIDVIANHVCSFAEFEWFNHEGITLFQGDLIAKPEFEKLPLSVIPALDKG